MSKLIYISLIVIVVFSIVLAGCAKQSDNLQVADQPKDTATPPESSTQQEQQKTSLPNPASVNCIDKGGNLEIRKTAGGETGYCLFKNGKECEEWQLFRGECSAEVQQAITAKPEETTQKETGISQQDLDNLKKSIDSINTENINSLSA